jgi:pimeloyl-ACP methyl ester carboxylesterase
VPPRPLPLLALLALAGPALGQPPGKGIALTPCQLGSAESSARVAARCGTLLVPEDHARPEGRKISVHVGVVDAESTSAEPDPLFLLAGGPGQAASEAFPAVLAALQQVGRFRDLVLVDQRGTGRSSRLPCPDLDDPGAIDRSDEEELRQVKRCAAELAGRADLRQYGSAAFARDLDLVRAALGYRRVNLLGGSYGTRAAMVYARDFPARVRALVLDGVAPMQMAIGEGFAEDSQRALSRAFSRCAEDPACHGRFPALADDLSALLRELASRPARLRVRDPLGGQPVPLELRATMLRSIVFLLLYSP